MQTLATVEYASPTTPKTSPRLLSLDVFRGLVILAMLLVNNIGDGATTGYFWKHAGWPMIPWAHQWRIWLAATTGRPFHLDSSDRFLQEFRALDNERVELINRFGFSSEYAGPPEFARRMREHDLRANDLVVRSLEQVTSAQLSAAGREIWLYVPLFRDCTLADYVMPWFMLIIGVAIPFSVAASSAKGVSGGRRWARTLQRAATLVALGWILCYFRDQFPQSFYGNAPWTLSLGMDVLQLLGISYLVARILYECSAVPRAAIAMTLLVGHWALLRFWSQGDLPRGTFIEQFDAIGYIYDHWQSLHFWRVFVNFRGILSVPPAAATMLIGTLIGDWLRREVSAKRKIRALVAWGIVMCVVGFAWAFDLPFNKPRWTPSYLLWTSGVGTILIAILYWIVDVKNIRRWTYPLVVFGTNAIALYFCSIMAKVLLLNTPRVNGRPVIDLLLDSLKRPLGPWAGGWAFTIAFIGLWWVILDQMYRRRIFWRV